MLLYPASEAHIKKHAAENRVLIRETKKMYETVTKPLFVDSINHAKVNEWIYNVLEGKKEVELRVFENDLFITNLDYESNIDDKESLKCLALPK